MLAPFFTYDGDYDAGLFTLRQYARLWPDIPLEFSIPFSGSLIKDQYLRELPPNIRTSFLKTDRSLGKGFPEWIDGILSNTMADWFFWCSSDRYPIALASPASLARLLEGVAAQSGEIDAIRLARWRDAAGEDSFAIEEFAGLKFRRRPLGVHGLWHPQPHRGSYLRRLRLQGCCEGTLSTGRKKVS